ncbi:MAG TPA: chemotaxis protein CheB [Burkholderiales bacterium]|nr:chemotaxis protein CheB [Burkholderiales bacterium]
MPTHTERRDGDRLERGTAYVALPNRHLLVNPDGTLSLSQSELVHFVRPSADLLFESAAASYRERAIAVVLSGSGRDGAMGVKAIKKTGTVIVQDERTRRGNTAAAEKCFDKARELHERIAAVREAALGSEELDMEKLREKAG